MKSSTRTFIVLTSCTVFMCPQSQAFVHHQPVHLLAAQKSTSPHSHASFPLAQFAQPPTKDSDVTSSTRTNTTPPSAANINNQELSQKFGGYTVKQRLREEVE